MQDYRHARNAKARDGRAIVVRSSELASWREIGPCGSEARHIPEDKGALSAWHPLGKPLQIADFLDDSAEGEGFEPSVDRKAHNGFRDRPVQPLRHPSEDPKIIGTVGRDDRAYIDPSATPGTEEGAQECGPLLGQQSARHDGPVVEVGVR
jgi:hypothetical protein